MGRDSTTCCHKCKSANRPLACAKVQKWEAETRTRGPEGRRARAMQQVGSGPRHDIGIPSQSSGLRFPLEPCLAALGRDAMTSHPPGRRRAAEGRGVALPRPPKRGVHDESCPYLTFTIRRTRSCHPKRRLCRHAVPTLPQCKHTPDTPYSILNTLYRSGQPINGLTDQLLRRRRPSWR